MLSPQKSSQIVFPHLQQSESSSASFIPLQLLSVPSHFSSVGSLASHMLKPSFVQTRVPSQIPKLFLLKHFVESPSFTACSEQSQIPLSGLQCFFSGLSSVSRVHVYPAGHAISSEHSTKQNIPLFPNVMQVPSGAHSLLV
jgi:hypothetical protein